MREADLIFVFSRGHVVERGSFAELEARGCRHRLMMRMKIGPDDTLILAANPGWDDLYQHLE